MRLLFYPLILCFFSVSSWATELKIPALSSPVMDEANFFNATEKEDLSRLAMAIYQGGGPQITIFTVESLQGYEIEEFSIRVAESWKLGTKEKDNGLLLVIAKAERSMRLEVGNGIEGEITDYESSQYTQQILPAYFKQGEFYLGVKKLMLDVAQKFNISNQLESEGKLVQRVNNFNKHSFEIYLFVVAVIFLLASIFFPGKPLMRGTFSAILITLVCIPLALTIFWYLLIFILSLLGGVINLGPILLHTMANSRGGGGRSGGGGGGSWSGGGGGFSGGGSSGRW